MKKLIIQASSFFGISGIGWIMDMCIYTILLIAGVYATISNIFSSLVAVTFVYLVSTKKLFANKKSISIRKKYIIYVLYQVFIILLSSVVIGWLVEVLLSSNIKIFLDYAKSLSKIFITPFTMVTNFIFMKFLIEKV